MALYTGPDAPAHISSMAMDGDAVWITSGIHAIRYLRGKEVSLPFTLKSGCVKYFQMLRLSNPLGTNLSFITIFGPQLLALNEQGDKMLIWNTSNGGNCFSPHMTGL